MYLENIEHTEIIAVEPSGLGKGGISPRNRKINIEKWYYFQGLYKMTNIQEIGSFLIVFPMQDLSIISNRNCF